MKDNLRTLAGAGHLAWRRAPQLAGYAVVFKLLLALVLGPLSAALLAALVAWHGTASVGNLDLLAFFLSVPGALAALAWGGVAMLTVVLAQAGPILIAAEWLEGRPLSFAGAWWRTLRRAPTLLMLGLRWVAVCLALAVPFLGLAALAHALLWASHDLNYLWEERPPAFWQGAAVLAVLAAGYAGVAAWVALRWSLALPLCLLARRPSAAAVKDSVALTRGSLRRLAVLRLSGLAASLALMAVSLLALHLLGKAVLPWAGHSLARAVPTLAVLLALNALAVALLSVLAAVADALLVLQFYREVLARQAAEGGAICAAPPAAPAGWVTSRLALLAGAGLGAVLAALASLGIVESLDVKDRVAITAHRCRGGPGPENTVVVLRKAIEIGADYAELDVQETADGVVVVLHDSDLLRVADDRRKIWEVSFAELRRLDLGRRFGPAYAGTRVPALEEVIDAAGEQIRLNIELKFTRHQRRLAQSVVEILARKKFEGRCVVTSLDARGLREVRRLNPELKIGYIVSASVGDLPKLDVDFLSVRDALATPRLIAAAHKSGKPVHAWTVNDVRVFDEMVDRGVDNVITDEPAALLGRLAELRGLSAVERLVLRYRRALAD
jgi:glycerophosphoryl diester phosphodiesterase